MRKKIYYLGYGIITFFVLGSVFLFGAMFNQHPRYDLLNLVTRSVKDIMDYPEAVSYRNMNAYFSGYTRDKGKIVYICGEVFGFNEERPSEYKPFIVKVYISSENIVTISMPVIAFGKEIFTPEQVQKVWNLRCHNYSDTDKDIIDMNDGVYTYSLDENSISDLEKK